VIYGFVTRAVERFFFVFFFLFFFCFFFFFFFVLLVRHRSQHSMVGGLRNKTEEQEDVMYTLAATSERVVIDFWRIVSLIEASARGGHKQVERENNLMQRG
jgi:hypothetical protein